MELKDKLSKLVQEELLTADEFKTLTGDEFPSAQKPEAPEQEAKDKPAEEPQEKQPEKQPEEPKKDEEPQSEEKAEETPKEPVEEKKPEQPTEQVEWGIKLDELRAANDGLAARLETLESRVKSLIEADTEEELGKAPAAVANADPTPTEDYLQSVIKKLSSHI